MALPLEGPGPCGQSLAMALFSSGLADEASADFVKLADPVSVRRRVLGQLRRSAWRRVHRECIIHAGAITDEPPAELPRRRGDQVCSLRRNVANSAPSFSTRSCCFLSLSEPFSANASWALAIEIVPGSTNVPIFPKMART